MALSKKNLADKIKRKLGYPMIKVELDNTQIYDAIDYSRNKWMKWAVGQATQESFFTLMLSAGQTIYDMPTGTVEVIDYLSTGTTSGINTLFTIDNFLYNQGMYESLIHTAGGDAGYTLVSYHIARDFLETVRKYTPDKYNFKYHPYTNQLEINPAPPSGNSLVLTVSGVEYTYDSPGFVLVRSFRVEGSTVSSTWTSGDSDDDFHGLDWIFDYATADCKERLGMVRRKFENFASIGNTGIAMDGGDLIAEGKEEKERLLETLKDEEAYEGWGIEIGF
jgi:hypothetical protein